MSGRADLSDGEIKQSLDNVKSGKLNWFLLGHVPKSDVKFKVAASGNGGIEELKAELNDGKVQFGFIAVDLSGVRKFLYISWCGEGVSGMKKGYFNGQSQDLAAFFKGFHVQINARNEDDISSNDVLSRVKTAIGASFYRDHKAQDVENTPEKSSIQYESRDHNQSTENNPARSKITYETRDHNQSTENNPTRSNITYETRDHNQSTENNPAQSKVRYEQRAQDQSTESRPAPSRAAPPPVRPSPGAKAPVSAPPPQTSAPPPAPKPTPPPVQETQEEEYSEQPAEEEYAEEQQGEEEYAEEEYAEESQDQSGGSRCRALYAYQGEKEGDLSFNEGDDILVHDKSDPSGWWEGEVNGVRGYFPSNFVEEL
jgi:hypothetical protein